MKFSKIPKRILAQYMPHFTSDSGAVVISLLPCCILVIIAAMFPIPILCILGIAFLFHSAAVVISAITHDNLFKSKSDYVQGIISFVIFTILTIICLAPLSPLIIFLAILKFINDDNCATPWNRSVIEISDPGGPHDGKAYTLDEFLGKSTELGTELPWNMRAYKHLMDL